MHNNDNSNNNDSNNINDNSSNNNNDNSNNSCSNNNDSNNNDNNNSNDNSNNTSLNFHCIRYNGYSIVVLSTDPMQDHPIEQNEVHLIFPGLPPYLYTPKTDKRSSPGLRRRLVNNLHDQQQAEWLDGDSI